LYLDEACGVAYEDQFKGGVVGQRFHVDLRLDAGFTEFHTQVLAFALNCRRADMPSISFNGHQV
jgi:hypothetical protein